MRAEKIIRLWYISSLFVYFVLKALRHGTNPTFFS